jgi:hypothetical protein
MKLFTLREDEIIQRDTYSSVVHVNLDCVTHLEEIRYKPPVNGKQHEDVWLISLGDNTQSLYVTKAGFERIKQAMETP